MHRPFYITSKNFLTPEQCNALIDDAKSHAEAMEGGVYGEPEKNDDLSNADTMTVDKEARVAKSTQWIGSSTPQFTILFGNTFFLSIVFGT